MPAMFVFAEGGVGVMPDPADNPDNHQVPHPDAGVRISFEVANVGDEGGVAAVGVERDDEFVTQWESDHLDPGMSTVGYASLGRVSSGDHTALAYVNPGAGHSDHQQNTFTIP